MTKYKVQGSGKSVDLNQGNLKAKGGEGSIYIVGDIVYKVCDEGKMIPNGKFTELNLLDHPRIVKPESILLDSKNKPCGYTMKLVPNAVPLAQILSKTYREREGVSPNHMSDLVQQIADGLRFVHKKLGYLQVDGNELNYMVTDDYKSVYFIDVNSFQTPSYPADAIMASIRDYHCPKNSHGLYVWSHETDWYSFAIIAFYMFTGIHPFKGRHPKFTNLKTFMVDNMTACKSVLDKEVGFPESAVYFPFESFIPGGANGAYMQWFRATFVDNKRMPAPLDFQATINIIAKVKEIVGSNNFVIEELRKFSGSLIGFFENFGKEVAVTKDQIYLMNQGDNKPSNKFKIGFTPVLNVPIAAWLENNKLVLKNLESKAIIPCEIQGKNIMISDGRIYVQSTNDILEVMFFENKTSINAYSSSVASIMPTATEMFEGVAIQDMFGKKMVSVFPQSGHHRLLKIEELNEFKIIDAKFEGNVLMVVGNKDGEYSRFVFRFSKSWDSCDVRQIEDINPSGINFTVSDKGICVCLTEEEKIELFSNQKDVVGIKSISDPAIKMDMKLICSGAQIRFLHGNKVHSLSMRK